MSELIVAHRYAKSLLDFAIEKNVVDAVYTDMVGFKETCEGSKDLVLALKSPIIKHYTKLAILNKLFKSIFNPVTYSIFVIITNKNRESILPAIAKQFINLYTKIVKDYTGKEVQLTEHIDESLIGGFILRVGDQQIDDSIRRKLNDLKVTMAS